MNPKCPNCGYAFEREDGYYMGAIYINMFVTFGIITMGYYALQWYFNVPLLVQIIIWCLFAIAFPIFFFRYSRGIWLNLDHYFTKKTHSLEDAGKGIGEGN
jgi:uncharacterized protein (DUF983 family)